MSNGYDYIIVGAGSAGCVLANRLTEDGAARVLLIEAGGRDWHPFIHIPLGLGQMHKKRMFDWGYDSEPEPALNGRRIEAARGKVLGGSSSINVMAWTRGDPADYDRWAQKGATGWSYTDVLPYFKRVETWEEGANESRGGDGPVGAEWAKTTDPLFPAWVEAAKQAGLPTVRDYNGPVHEGFAHSQYSIRNGRRSSSANAYLHPIEKRKNLTVVTGTLVTRVMLDGTRATGVEYYREGNTIRATAAKEVILSAGTFNTPQVLMLSGIGPAEHLQSLGIKPVVDLAVGKNLQDHMAVLIFFARPKAGSFRDTMRFDRMMVGLFQAYLFGTGAATIVPGGMHAFVKTRPELAVPDIEFMFRGAPSNAHLWFPGIKSPYTDGYAIRPTLLHPDSRGEVTLTSSDPRSHVRIRYNPFSAPNDMPTLIKGFHIARDVAYQPALAPFRGTETNPGEKVKTDAEIEAYIRKTAVTAHHPASTCPMGITPESVLDPDFRVRGIENLRVVDASAMPDLVSAHINATVMMMAEKAADLIRGRKLAA